MLETIQNLDPRYCEALELLHSKLENEVLENPRDEVLRKNKIYQEFSDNYFTLASTYTQWKNDIYTTLNFDNIKLRSEYHFDFSIAETKLYETQKKLRNNFENSELSQRKNLTALKKLLSYPNEWLNPNYQLFEESSSSFISKKFHYKVKFVESLYHKIKTAENSGNYQKWLEYLKESEDDSFIKHTIETRISQTLTDKSLWKLYIDYLKVVDPKEMLQVYSKYCRFFISDIEMKTKYEEAVSTFGPVSVPWKNLYEFEKSGDWPVKTCKFLEVLDEEEQNPSSCTLFFDKTASPLLQHFAFNNNFISRLLQTAPTRIISKLHQSCEQFVFRHPYLPCHRFIATSSSLKFDQNSVEFDQDNDNSIFNNKFHIGTSLTIFYDASKLIQNVIYRCDAKYIYLECLRMTDVELKFLIESGNVESLTLNMSHVKNSNGEEMSVEEIFVMTPRIRKFKSTFSPITNPEALFSLTYQNSIEYFYVEHDVTCHIDYETYILFLKEHCLPTSEIDFIFDESLGQDYIDDFKKKEAEFFESWKK